jgi:hypothetical protein
VAVRALYASLAVNANEGSRRRSLSLPPRRKWWSGRWRGRVVAAFVLASAALCGSVPVAAGSSSDVQATHAYLVARYKLVRALLHEAAEARGAESSAAAQIARECPGVVSGMPQEPSLPLQTSPPRARGENARSSQQKETIEEELDTAVDRPGGSLHRLAKEAYAAEVRQLSWSNPAIASMLQAATAARLEVISGAAPPFCADARAWAQSGYRALSATSREFETSRAARMNSEQVEEHSLGALLKPYENASDRALIRKAKTAELELLLSESAVVRTLRGLDRILGLPQVGTEEPKSIIVGHGRTAAGTRFQVSTGSGLLGALSSCHHSAAVAYTRPSAPEVLILGGPNNPICLSSPQYRHPAVFCEEGIETIQTAVPASVRSVGLVLADRRTIGSRVVRVSRRDGGPAGIYAQEIGGSTSHAVSLVEMNAGGVVVLTVKLPRYRCVKSHSEPEGLPTVTELASGRTPEGEPFTISAFGSINGEPGLSVDTGVDPELNEIATGPGVSKAFTWSLSIGCAPHPYAILYGILMPPGESVVARTAQGTVALNIVPVEPRVRAKGPLVYGVFTVLPSELTVLGTNGSTVYTENLQAKATEAAQFCEGYAEP